MGLPSVPRTAQLVSIASAWGCQLFQPSKEQLCVVLLKKDDGNNGLYDCLQQ